MRVDPIEQVADPIADRSAELYERRAVSRDGGDFQETTRQAQSRGFFAVYQALTVIPTTLGKGRMLRERSQSVSVCHAAFAG